ncbi:hypothetical protein GCM10028805_18210 [Spirosoma harenae]
MRTRLLLVLCVFLKPVFPVAAQCPDRQAVYTKLLDIEKLPTNPAIIKAATQLANQSVQCRATNDSVYARVLHLLGRIYMRERNFPKSEYYTKQAISVNSRPSALTSEANLANSYNNLGKILTEQSRYAEAISAYDQAIFVAKRYPARLYVGAIALGQKALLYFLQGDYEKANLTAEQGAQMAKQANSPAQIAQNQGQQVQALLEMKQYIKAETVLNESTQFIQSLNDPPLFAYILSLGADVHKALNLYAVAIADYQKAFAIYEQTKSRYGCAQTLTNLGYLYQIKLNNFPKALQLYNQALTYVDDSNDRARIIDNIGVIQKEQKNYQQALSLFQEAFRAHSIQFTAKNLSINPTANAVKIILQKEYLFSTVLNKADTWLDWAKTIGNDRVRLQNALKTYALADSMVDFMRWEHTGQQSKLFWRDKTHRLYEQAIETCFRLNDDASAYRFIEKSRAVLLNDKLNELGANRQLSPDQARKEQQFRQHVTDWQTKLANEKPNTPAYTKALDSLRIGQEEQETFIRQVERSNPAYYRYKYDNQVISLAQVQEQLAKRNASLVTYFVGDSTLFALSISPTSTKRIQVSAPAYTKAASELLALNANPDAQNQQFIQYLKISNQLYQQLLAPLSLKPGRVIISPDGVLLPFDALSVSANRPDFLVNQFAFSYAYSVNRLFRETTTNAWFSRKGTFLGVAPVQFSASLHQLSLTGSDESLKRIGSRFSSPTLLTGREATRQAFGQQASNHRIIQLFTHAEADSTAIEPSLFFADSALRLSDLTTSELLSIELVGLSACKTGIGANQRGEGVFSLARGFASLGVPSVLTTLWNVESQATYDLTERFYTKLADGLPKDLALQQAKQEYLASSDLSGQLPYRWAGLLLLGNTDALPKGTNLAIWGIGFFVLILAVASWWYRKQNRYSATA